MISLSYNGQMTVESDEKTAAHDLLNSLFELDADPSPIQVDTGQIRPRSSGAAFVVSLSAETDIQTVESVQSDLADALTALNIEENRETATDRIRISK
jgi:DNA polymerase IIIc chi subunit